MIYEFKSSCFQDTSIMFSVKSKHSTRSPVVICDIRFNLRSRRLYSIRISFSLFTFAQVNFFWQPNILFNLKINAARKGKGNVKWNGCEAYKCVLGQMHNKYTRKQVQLERIKLPFQLRSALYGFESHYHEALSVHAMNREWESIGFTCLTVFRMCYLYS